MKNNWIWSPEDHHKRKRIPSNKSFEEPVYIPASFSNIKWAPQKHYKTKKD